MMGQGSYGFSLRGHKPARISGVDEDTSAMVSGGCGLHMYQLEEYS